MYGLLDVMVKLVTYTELYPLYSNVNHLFSCYCNGQPLTWEGTFNKVFKKLQVAVLQLSLNVYFGQQGVATAELALQVLGTPEALELPVDHHCQPGAQSLTLLHTGEGRYQRDRLKVQSCFLLFLHQYVACKLSEHVFRCFIQVTLEKPNCNNTLKVHY